jgi:hypothetical protein
MVLARSNRWSVDSGKGLFLARGFWQGDSGKGLFLARGFWQGDSGKGLFLAAWAIVGSTAPYFYLLELVRLWANLFPVNGK